MSETVKIELAKAMIVRDISNELDNFFRCSMFEPDALRNSHRIVGVAFKKLEESFPEIAKAAQEYYEAELPPFDEPTFDEGFGDALFSTFLSLRAFYDAESVGNVLSAEDELRNHLFDLATWCEGYNAERGFWMMDLNLGSEITID